MKKALPFILVTLVLLSLLSQLDFHHPPSKTSVNEDESAEQMANAAYDHMRMADPATGKIPFGAEMRAFSLLQQRGFYSRIKNASLKTASESGWHQANDFFPSLSVTKITYDPNQLHTYYFCTGEGWFNADAVKGAGVFKSVDAGETWTQLAATDTSIFDYCQDIVVHPLTSDIYVATRTGGLQRSADGGVSFEKVLGFGVGSSKNSVCDIELTADGGVFASIGIFETDGIYFSPSGDAGTFVKKTSGLPTTGYYRIKLATAPSDPDIAYAIYCNSSDYRVKGIYKTTDKGNTWTEINRPENNYEFAAKQAWYDLSMAVDPNDANVVAMGGLNIWRTRDGGENWQRISSGTLDSVLVRYVHVDQHEIVFHTSDEVYFTNDGGIWKCDNFTADIPFIYNRNYGYDVTQFYSVALHATPGNPQVMGGTQDNGTPYAYNEGLSEFKFVSGADGAFTAFNHQNSDIFYTATQLRKIFRFDNGGFEMPDTINNPNLTDANTLFINPFDIDAADPEVLYQCSNIGLWRLKNASTADSTQWQKMAAISGVLTAIGSSPAAPGVVYIGRNSGSGDIYRIDTAYTSNAITVPFDADPNDMLPDAAFLSSIYCSSIVVDPNNGNHVIVTYSNYNVPSIWESENAMSASPTWTNIEGDLPDIPVYWSAIHPVNNKVMYIATQIGVFYTNGAEGTATHWIPCTTFPLVRTDMLRIRTADKTIVAATHGRGIWQAQLDPVAGMNDILWLERGPVNVGGRTRTVMVDPNDPTGKTVWAGSIAGGLWKTTDINTVPVETPDVAASDINVFPNPATSILHIVFHVESAQPVHISLININGETVADIAHQQMQGDQSITYALSASAPNGIYFLRVETGKKSSIKKLVVAR